jgi:WD40 repeat protein
LFESKKADDVSIIICLSRMYYAELLLELIAILGCLFFVAGVLAMAWCPSDSSLLLSCAKDNRTLCWDTISGQVLCELPASGNWNFDVQWSPCTPGVLSTSSFDGQIGIYNIEVDPKP